MVPTAADVGETSAMSEAFTERGAKRGRAGPVALPDDDRLTLVEGTGQPDLGAMLRADAADVRERAWRILYDEQFARVYRLVCRFGVEASEVEELTQRAFVVAFRRIGEVEHVHNPGAWLRGIVVRLVAQHRRWRRVREAKKWLLRDLRVAAPQPVPPVRHDAAERIDHIRTVLQQLSAKLRDVLVLCDVEECTPKEAAELLRVPVNTVRSRRQAARAKFLDLWRRQYGDDHEPSGGMR